MAWIGLFPSQRGVVAVCGMKTCLPTYQPVRDRMPSIDRLMHNAFIALTTVSDEDKGNVVGLREKGP